MKDYLVHEMNPFRATPKGLFGIEVEVEGAMLPREDPTGVWKVVADGSLRGECAEYVLRTPLDLDKAKNGIIHLNKLLENSLINMSYRTSVHVHVNIIHMRMSQLRRFVYTSYLLENLLVHFSGEDRIGNRFCLRVADAEGQLQAIGSVISAEGQIYRLSNDEFKYAAINLVPIRGQGSVEFRSMQGTTDVGTISTWLGMLDKIVSFAKSSEMPCRDISEWAAQGPEDFLNYVMGEYAQFLKFPEFEDGIRRAEENLYVLSLQEPKNEKVEIEEKPLKPKLGPAPGFAKRYHININAGGGGMLVAQANPAAQAIIDDIMLERMMRGQEEHDARAEARREEAEDERGGW